MTTKEYRQARFERPPGATEILLVRHGESRSATADNPFPLVDGHGDPELHEQGRHQAERVGERLKHLPIEAIYATKLRRTQETAQPLCNHLGQRSIIDPDLHEVHLGEWEGGVFRIKVHENDPIYQRMQLEERWDAIPGAESWTQINERVMRGLNRIHDAHPNQMVVAVLHGGIIGHILAHATSASPFAFGGADNGSISHIVMLNNTIAVRRFNDTSHISENVAYSAGLPT